MRASVRLVWVTVWLGCGVYPVAGQLALTAWPPEGTPLTQNPVVLVEAHGPAADWLATTALEAYTASGALPSTVLSVVQRPGFRQVLLKPTQLLAAGQVLRLRTREGSGSRTLRAVHPRAAVYRALLAQLNWPIQQGVDTTAPYWLGPATPVGYSEQPTVCGPLPHAAIWCPLRETQPLLLAVQLKLASGKPQRWLLPLAPAAAGNVLLSTDSCLALPWVTGTTLVGLVAVDASGNAAPMPDGTLVLHVPAAPESGRRSWASRAHGPLLVTVAVLVLTYWWLFWHLHRRWLGRRRVRAAKP